MWLGHGRIAQLGEHLPYKQGVTGSSPVVPTTGKKINMYVVWWLRWLECRPVTPEVEGSIPFQVAIWLDSSVGRAED